MLTNALESVQSKFITLSSCLPITKTSVSVRWLVPSNLMDLIDSSDDNVMCGKSFPTSDRSLSAEDVLTFGFISAELIVAIFLLFVCLLSLVTTRKDFIHGPNTER